MTPTLSAAGPAAAEAASAPGIDALVERVCARTAPTWPLDRFIAVNPFWGMVDRPLSAVAAELASLSGTRLLMPRAWFRDIWRHGHLRQEHLEAAIDSGDASTTPAALVALLQTDESAPRPRARVMDVVDAGRDLVHHVSWRDFVVNNTSQFCAAFFDEGQARLGPDRDGGLYASWRRQAIQDKSPALLMGLADCGSAVRALPGSSREMVSHALAELGVSAADRELYLASLLLDLNGWAAWCMYRRWTARLAGRDDDAIVDLLGVRAAWEWMLFRTNRPGIDHRWRHAMAAWAEADAAGRACQEDDWLLQKAVEIAWQAELCRRLPQGLSTSAPGQVAVQAIFCIDVRSEVFRRALEIETAHVQTLGFAGFFGLPIEFQPLGAAAARPQLPGLLAPRLRATDTALGADTMSRRTERLDAAGTWSHFKTGPVSTFGFIEAMGLAYAGRLIADGLGLGRAANPDNAGLSREESKRRRPRLTATSEGHPVEPQSRIDLAAGMLRAMSLTRNFARLVLLVGHGSETRNNPFAAGLDCGACCGQTGEVNARVAAALLNAPEVRRGLAERGILVPGSTLFLAALHNTTTDEVSVFDRDLVPGTHAADVDRLSAWLTAAGDRARAERASDLGLASLEPAAVRRAVRARTRDWSEVRPEWGLANNAAFIVAPREHCRHLNLRGRSFLHEYRFEEDTDFSVLELIMTAPMVVAHWINLQYYASTVDNARYGSGNKVLHNVVGGHVGVFEGNGGDLRIGLPIQSLHDGRRWMHTPLRLSVFIESPRSAIDGVLQKHHTVRDLVTNGWLDLLQIDPWERVVHSRRAEGWVRAAVAEPV